MQGPATRPHPAHLDPAHAELTSDAASLVSKLESDAAAGAEQAPRVRAETSPTAPTREFSAPEIFTSLDLDSAMKAMREATQRGHVAEAIMSYAVGLFDAVALCVVRDNMAFGWKASGPNLDRERIETLLIPLDAPSMFRTAIHTDTLFHAVPPPGTLHTYLYRVLRCRPPTTATVAAMNIGKRVVNLLYGHRNDRDDLSETEFSNLRQVCKAATDAYVRLIAESKKTGDIVL
jgi:hypothetical protein